MNKKPFSYWILFVIIFILFSAALLENLQLINVMDHSWNFIVIMSYWPVLLGFIAQIVLIIGGLIWLLVKVGRWSKSALITWGVLSPFLVLVAYSYIGSALFDGFSIKSNEVWPIFAMASLFIILPTVAYYDIKYGQKDKGLL